MEFRIWTEAVRGKAAVLRQVAAVARRSCFKEGEGVRAEYATDYARDRADVIMVALEATRAVGFILARHEVHSLYLAVICSDKSAGGLLLDAFLQYADKEGLTVSLSALPAVLGLYPKPRFGFQFRSSCAPRAHVLDSSAVVGRKTGPDITKDPVFAPFVQLLQRKGFNVAKEGRCKAKTLSVEEIIENHCENDGYTMFRCRAAREGSPARHAARTPAPTPARTASRSTARSPARRPRLPAPPEEPREKRARRERDILDL